MKFNRNIAFGQKVYNKHADTINIFIDMRYKGKGVYGVFTYMSHDGSYHLQEYSIPNCPPDGYFIEHVLRDYYEGILEHITNGQNNIFISNHKIGDRYKMLGSTNAIYRIVVTDDNKYTLLCEANHRLHSKWYDTLEKMVQKEFPEDMYRKL